MLFRADHVADLELVVVDHAGHVVKAGAVGPLDHVVLLSGPLELDPAANQVVDHQRPFAGHLQPHHRLAALGLEAGTVLGRLGHPAPAIEKRLLRPLGRLAFRLDLFRRGIVVIGGPAIEELLDRRLVTRKPLRLVVGPVRAADLGPFVPIDPQPLQAVEDRRQGFLDVPLLVGIVDPQDELAAVPPGKEPAEQSRADPTNMEVARRAGSKPRADHKGRTRAKDLGRVHGTIGYRSRPLGARRAGPS